jgi:hypothetical protein
MQPDASDPQALGKLFTRTHEAHQAGARFVAASHVEGLQETKCKDNAAHISPEISRPPRPLRCQQKTDEKQQDALRWHQRWLGLHLVWP